MPTGMSRGTNAGMIATTERRLFVMNQRKAGLTYQQIARACVDEFGVDGLPKHWDERSVYKDIKRVLDKMRAETTETADEVRQIELERLDAMLAGVWDKATSGNAAAIDRAIKIGERRAKLLGIDAPDKVEGAQKITVEYVRDPVADSGITRESTEG